MSCWPTKPAEPVTSTRTPRKLPDQGGVCYSADDLLPSGLEVVIFDVGGTLGATPAVATGPPDGADERMEKLRARTAEIQALEEMENRRRQAKELEIRAKSGHDADGAPFPRQEKP